MITYLVATGFRVISGIGLFIVFFAAAHVFKAARFYLVLLEQDIPLKSYLFLYARTTFGNLIIPFKLGEIYRVAAVYRITKKGVPSFLSVCVDRFFDTAALLAMIIPFSLIYTRSLETGPLILFMALFMILLIYLSFAPTYRYLNEYIIMRRRSERSLNMLKWLEAMKEWYDFAGGLIKGRAPLIIICSLLGWGAEFVALKGFCRIFGDGFYMEDFVDYINSLLSVGADHTARLYNTTGVLIFGVITLVCFCIWLTDKKRFERNGRETCRIS